MHTTRQNLVRIKKLVKNLKITFRSEPKKIQNNGKIYQTFARRRTSASRSATDVVPGLGSENAANHSSSLNIAQSTVMIDAKTQNELKKKLKIDRRRKLTSDLSTVYRTETLPKEFLNRDLVKVLNFYPNNGSKLSTS